METGTITLEGKSEELLENSRVVSAYLGHEWENLFIKGGAE
jgi:ABC-type branched-subunit amino acid transport system ATPase component